MSDYDVYLVAMCLLFYVAGVLSAVFASSWLKSRRDDDPGYGDGYQSPGEAAGAKEAVVVGRSDELLAWSLPWKPGDPGPVPPTFVAPRRKSWLCEKCGQKATHWSGDSTCFRCQEADLKAADLKKKVDGIRGFYEKAGML